MRRIVVIRYLFVFVVGLAIAFGEDQPREAKGRDKEAAKAHSTAVPAGASEISPGLFKHTDGAGKSWLYRKTPFGVVKTAETLEADQKAANPAPAERGNPFSEKKGASSNRTTASVTAVEDGDSYKFERSTPFGPSRWTRKKSELTAEELQIVEKARARTTENAVTK
jgi:hypothetical protein